ncbi:MAG: hypothetical protein AB7P20_14575 [Rhizobiaceae bacterium]
MSDRSSASATADGFGRRSSASRVERLDIVDADYVVVDAPQAPTAEFAQSRATSPAADLSPPTGIEMLRRDAPRTPARSTRGGPLFWTGGAMLAAAAFWVAGGHAVIRPMVAARQPENPMRIASVISRVDRSGIRPVLQIDGQAINEGGEATAMPSLNIEVLSPSGGSMHYKLGASGTSVESGGSFAFSSRLDMPEAGVRTVFVTFAE